MKPIVIATGNPHKVRELGAIFAEQSIPVVGLREVGAAEMTGGAGGAGGASAPFSEPEETGSTFEENAAIKARSYAAHTGRPCLADDSGLEVDALGGAPGVISSHYATGGRDTGLTRNERDRDNNARLLEELSGVSDEARAARFVCVMCLADPEGRILARARGTFEGRIGRPPHVPRGDHGFGYDPLFLVAPDFTRTSAELAPEEKNRLSHRADAARRMALAIRNLRLL